MKLENPGEHTVLTMPVANVLLPPSQLRFTPKAQGSQLNGSREGPGQVGVFCNRKNPNRSVNIIIYLSLQ